MIIFFALILLLCLITAAVNLYIIATSKKRILPHGDTVCQDYDCILILGAAVWPGNVPCPILEDRLLTGITFFRQKKDAVLLMSGDVRFPGHDEVSVMKDFALMHGVPAENILTDPSGLTTRDSARRARDVYHVRKTVIVTQKYHLYRALYIAGKLGLQAWGAASDRRRYRRRCYRELREILARMKYFFLY